MSPTDRTVFATVRKVHGIKGGLRIRTSRVNLEQLPDQELFFVKLDDAWQTFHLEGLAGTLDDPILYFTEIQDRNDAVGLHGKTLYVPADSLRDLADDEYLIADLIGCSVKEPDGRLLGTVIRVEEPGQHEVLVVELPEGSERMIPMVEAWIRSIDLQSSMIVVEREESLS